MDLSKNCAEPSTPGGSPSNADLTESKIALTDALASLGETQVQLHPENSPNQAIHAGPGANVNVNRFASNKERLSNLLIALCVVALVALTFAYRYDAQERDLDRYDDQQRQEKIDKELADLRSEIKVNSALIQAYGLQKAVKGK